ncbi:MAG: hypothetical protein E6G33_04900 [Actinobacteria bacterium]|nr:MAG: hypothetical protein E6G33_04900 [Actinomycetota bacterium]
MALGPGEGRIKRADGSLVRANAVFYIDHSNVRQPQPVRVSVSGLHITVPLAKRMNGVAVHGHEVTPHPWPVGVAGRHHHHLRRSVHRGAGSG